MKNKGKIFVIIYAIIAILASLSILRYFVNNLEQQFTSNMERNSLIFQDRIIKINDVLELQGKKANLFINLDDLPVEFENRVNVDLLKFITYDESRDIFHFDKIQNSDYDLSKISNITGKGNIDFLSDNENLKTLEMYLLIFMNKEFYWLNDKLESSDWVYYTSLNQMASMRTRSGQFVTSDDFHYTDEMLNMSFVTGGYKENLPTREEVYWSSPYVDLAGNGIMITASYPVDYQGKYIGSISIDFVSNSLSKLLSEKYKTIIVDSEGALIATNIKDLNLSKEHKTVDDLSLGFNFVDIKDIGYEKVKYVNGNIVIGDELKGSPYLIYQVYPKEIYLKDAAIDFFPVVLIFIFFGVTSLMLYRVRESETKLKVTLSELEQKQEELDYISKYDPLTNIYNRRGLYSELKKLENEGNIVGSSVILFDIDHFKLVNDTYGHDVGDEVLTEICIVIKSYIGDNEIFARYGGEEFIIVSKGTTLEKTCEIAEKVRAGVENHKFKTIESLTISLGVSNFRAKDTNDTWIANADAALYKAKTSGRNKVYYYESYEFVGYTDMNS